MYLLNNNINTPSAYIPVRVALITCWKNAFVASSEASGLKPGAKGGSGSFRTCTGRLGAGGLLAT